MSNTTVVEGEGGDTFAGRLQRRSCHGGWPADPFLQVCGCKAADLNTPWRGLYPKALYCPQQRD